MKKLNEWQNKKTKQEQEALMMPVRERSQQRIFEIENQIINLEAEIKSIEKVNRARMAQLEKEREYLIKQLEPKKETPKVEPLIYEKAVDNPPPENPVETHYELPLEKNAPIEPIAAEKSKKTGGKSDKKD